MEIVKRRCRICGHMRKFVFGSERDLKKVCGDCWNWEAEDDALIYSN